MHHLRTRVILSACALLAFTSLWGCVPADLSENALTANNNSDVVNPVKGDMAAIMRGEAEFTGTCTACHNIDGSAGPVAPRGLTESASLADGVLFSAIKNGVSGSAMAAYGDQYTDDQIWDFVAFVQSYGGASPNNTTANNTTPNNTSPNNTSANNTTANNTTANNTTANNTSMGTNPLDGDAQAIANGEATFDSACVACHNKDGSMGPVSTKALDDTAVNLTDAEVYSKISDGVSGTAMSAYGSTYNETEIWELVSWIRTLAE